MGTNFVDPKDASKHITWDSLTLFYLNARLVNNKRYELESWLT